MKNSEVKQDFGDEVLNIYPSAFKCVLWALVMALVLLVTAMPMTIDTAMPMTIDKVNRIEAKAGAIFFILLFGTGFFIFFRLLILKIRNVPIAKIYTDRIEWFPVWRGCKTIHFSDVRLFKKLELNSLTIITAYLQPSGEKELSVMNSSAIVGTLNSCMVSDIDKICDILNERLEKYKK